MFGQFVRWHCAVFRQYRSIGVDRIPFVTRGSYRPPHTTFPVMESGISKTISLQERRDNMGLRLD